MGAGQLDQIAGEVYDTRLKIRVLQEENTSTVPAQLQTAAAAAAGPHNVLVKYRLDFDNSAYVEQHAAVQTFDRMQLPSIPVGVLLRLFPFGVVIGRGIRIMDAGEKLLSVWGAATADDVRGHPVVEHFVLRRPRDIPFTWTNVSNAAVSILVFSKKREKSLWTLSFRYNSKIQKNCRISFFYFY